MSTSDSSFVVVDPPEDPGDSEKSSGGIFSWLTSSSKKSSGQVDGDGATSDGTSLATPVGSPHSYKAGMGTGTSGTSDAYSDASSSLEFTSPPPPTDSMTPLNSIVRMVANTTFKRSSLRQSEKGVRNAGQPGKKIPRRRSSFGSGSIKEEEEEDDEDARITAETIQRRTDKWEGMMNNWTLTTLLRRRKLKLRIRKGVPIAIRSRVWSKLADLEERRNSYLLSSRKDMESQLEREVIETIEKDIDRTFPTHPMFSDKGGPGQTLLRQMLLGYATIDNSVGYCQGMNYIAGLIMTYYDDIDEAFIIFSVILREKTFRGIFLPGLVDVQKKLYVLSELGNELLPDLFDHFEDENIKVGMYATEWFMTLFCKSFDMELGSRVIECFLQEGFKVMYRVALGVLESVQDELLELSFEKILPRLKEVCEQLNVEEIMKECWTIPVRTADIVRLEKAFDEERDNLIL
jgi:TBC1 domain family member 10